MSCSRKQKIHHINRQALEYREHLSPEERTQRSMITYQATTETNHTAA